MNKISKVFSFVAVLFLSASLFNCSMGLDSNSEKKAVVADSSRGVRTSAPDPKFFSINDFGSRILFKWCGTTVDITRYKITVVDKKGDEVTIFPSSMVEYEKWNPGDYTYDVRINKQELFDLVGSYDSTIGEFKLYYKHESTPIKTVHQSMGNIPSTRSGNVSITYFDSNRNYVKYEWTDHIFHTSASYFLKNDKYKKITPVMILGDKTVVFKKTDLTSGGSVATISVHRSGNGGVHAHGRINTSKPLPTEKEIAFRYNSSSIIQAQLPVSTPENRRGYAYYVVNGGNTRVYPFYKFVSFRLTEFTNIFGSAPNQLVKVKIYSADNLAVTYTSSFYINRRIIPEEGNLIDHRPDYF